MARETPQSHAITGVFPAYGDIGDLPIHKVELYRDGTLIEISTFERISLIPYHGRLLDRPPLAARSKYKKKPQSCK